MAKIDDDMPADDEARAYALFFAACSLATVDDTCGFNFLLEKNSATTLPVQISLALQYEMSQSGKSFANSKAVKDFERKLKKVMRPDIGGRLDQDSRLKLLFTEPLSAKNSKASVSEVKKTDRVKRLIVAA